MKKYRIFFRSFEQEEKWINDIIKKGYRLVNVKNSIEFNMNLSHIQGIHVGLELILECLMKKVRFWTILLYLKMQDGGK